MRLGLAGRGVGVGEERGYLPAEDEVEEFEEEEIPVTVLRELHALGDTDKELKDELPFEDLDELLVEVPEVLPSRPGLRASCCVCVCVCRGGVGGVRSTLVA